MAQQLYFIVPAYCSENQFNSGFFSTDLNVVSSKLALVDGEGNKRTRAFTFPQLQEISAVKEEVIFLLPPNEDKKG